VMAAWVGAIVRGLLLSNGSWKADSEATEISWLRCSSLTSVGRCVDGRAFVCVCCACVTTIASRI
jgi:hypothetical protein